MEKEGEGSQVIQGGWLITRISTDTLLAVGEHGRILLLSSQFGVHFMLWGWDT